MLHPNSVDYEPQCLPEYASPEIVRGEAFDMTADWWAVGVIAYMLMFGVLPFANRVRNK